MHTMPLNISIQLGLVFTLPLFICFALLIKAKIFKAFILQLYCLPAPVPASQCCAPPRASSSGRVHPVAPPSVSPTLPVVSSAGWSRLYGCVPSRAPSAACLPPRPTRCWLLTACYSASYTRISAETNPGRSGFS